MSGLSNTFVVFEGPQEFSTQEVINHSRQFDALTGTSSDGLLVVTPMDIDEFEQIASQQNAQNQNEQSQFEQIQIAQDRYDSGKHELIRMEYWNNDGTKAEMCGNGLRCAVRFAVDNKFVAPGACTVLTDAGLLKAIWHGNPSTPIEVQVGKAIFSSKPVELLGSDFYEVNVGNPHAVTFVLDLDKAPVKAIGPQIETHPHFPNKTNVEFVEVQGSNKISMRVWERGVGETLACGTGMVAAANAAVALKMVEFPLEVEVPGGIATLWIDEEGYTRMRGTADYI